MDYLPKDATIQQACQWLQAKTGETWILPRLLECHLTPYFWLDYKPGLPAIFGDRIEGYQTRMVFQGDICRLESDASDALVNMFTAHDGQIVKTEPGWRVPLSELRFKREAIERVAEIISMQAQPQQETTTPEPVQEVGKKSASGVTEMETAPQRQERRYQMCIDAGLDMPTSDYGPWPRGIGNVAKKEKITRQAFRQDVAKHINRMVKKMQA